MPVARYVKQVPVNTSSKDTVFFVIAELLIFTLIGWIALTYGIVPPTNHPQVLSTHVVAEEPTSTPQPTPLPAAVSETPVSPTPKKLPKNSYTIALVGDSMIDTMGERMEYLEHALKEKYPDTNFTLYNYGIGAENVEQGLARLGTDFHHLDRNYPILYQTDPDIVIVGSYAYNPFFPYDRDRHWLGLTNLIRDVQKITPNVFMLDEIAPLRSDFGRGPNGVNWDTNTAYTHSQHIIEQLENARNLSKTLNVPLIDAYTDSLDHGQVKREYVNPSDGIHPSVKGHEYIAHKIVEALTFEK